MVTIELKENHRLRSDAKQWIFEKKTNSKNKDGEDIYNPISFHGTVESAMKSSFDYFIRQSDAKSFSDLRLICMDLIDHYAKNIGLSDECLLHAKKRWVESDMKNNACGGEL